MPWHKLQMFTTVRHARAVEVARTAGDNLDNNKTISMRVEGSKTFFGVAVAVSKRGSGVWFIYGDLTWHITSGHHETHTWWVDVVRMPWWVDVVRMPWWVDVVRMPWWVDVVRMPWWVDVVRMPWWVDVLCMPWWVDVVCMPWWVDSTYAM